MNLYNTNTDDLTTIITSACHFGNFFAALTGTNDVAGKDLGIPTDVTSNGGKSNSKTHTS